MSEESEIVLLAIAEVMGDALDEFIGACLDDDGKPKAPTMRELMKARAMLPPRCVHALKKG